MSRSANLSPVPLPESVAVMVGAGVAGRMLLANSTLGPEISTIKIAAILDDREELHGNSIFGVKIVGGLKDLSRVIMMHNAETVIVASSRRDNDLIKQVTRYMKDVPVRILQTPTYEDLMCGMRIGELSESFGHWQDPTDSRRPKPIYDHHWFRNQSVLVTGAGGSIGSEVVRQLAISGCERIVCLDRDESHLTSSILRASRVQQVGSLEVVLADIRDIDAVRSAVLSWRPEVVIHAAALKHVSILERFPLEAWKTNVLGTANVIQVARSAEVPVFINISTDKAASPCSALGFSKLITERLIVGAVNKFPEVCQNWHSVRFGNVTRSRGSVFETFEQQASSGGPLTVSHPEVRRFFISIERAASFVIESVNFAHAAETLIPSMPVEMRILDIATRIAERFDPAPKIDISGLKPGEKLFEILVSEEDGVVRMASHDGAIAIMQSPIHLDEVTMSPVDGENALAMMQRLCA